jgi:hypothetical protein
VLYARQQHVPITIVRLDSTRQVPPRPEEVETVLAFFHKFLDVYRPDVLLTYGGDPITLGMIAEARRRGVTVVFALHNFAYTDARWFSNVDYCLVASEFARRHYRDRIGLDCRVLDYSVDWGRVRAPSREPRFVTFVNPSREKGVYAFARIAHELGRRRPDAYPAHRGREPGHQGRPRRLRARSRGGGKSHGHLTPPACGHCSARVS